MKRFLSVLITLCLVFGTVAVVPAFAVSNAVIADADALTVDDILSVPAYDGNKLIDNLDLDFYTQGEVNQSPVSWSSSNPDVISATGKVTRAAQDTEVTVTATIGEGDNIVTKDFTFVVPASSKFINAMPGASNVVFSEDFTGLTDFRDTNIKFKKSGSTTSTFEVKNGKSTINYPGWDGEQGWEIAIPSSLDNKKFVLEFTLNSTSDRQKIRFINANYSEVYQTIWNGLEHASKIGDVDANGSKLKYAIYFNTVDKELSIWVNNKLAVSNQKYSSSYKILALWLTIQASGSYDARGTVSLDNVKLYEVQMSPVANAYISAKDYIEEAAIYNGFITDHLNFAVKSDADGNEFVYSVSDSSLINADGTINNPLTDTPVTVTADITNVNGDTTSRSFNYVVPGKYNMVGLGALPRKAEVLHCENFNGARVSSMVDKNADKVTQENGKITFTTTVDTETSYRINHGVQYKSGIVVQEIIFDSTTQHLRIEPINEAVWNGKVGRIVYHKGYLHALNGSDNLKLSDNKYSGKIKLTIVNNITDKTYDVYVNGQRLASNIKMYGQSGTSPYSINAMNIIHREATHLGDWGSGKGTTNIYSYKVYTIDQTEYPSLMKGTEVISADNKTLKVPVIATNAEGAAIGGTIVYAIYSVFGNSKELAGVKVVNLELDEFSHREYTVAVDIDSVPENFETKIFYLNNMEGITPITTEDIPAK